MPDAPKPDAPEPAPPGRETVTVEEPHPAGGVARRFRGVLATRTGADFLLHAREFFGGGPSPGWAVVDAKGDRHRVRATTHDPRGVLGSCDRE